MSDMQDPRSHTGFMDPSNPANTMGTLPLFGWGLAHAAKEPFRALGQRSGVLTQEDIDRQAYNDAPYLQHPAAQWGAGAGNMTIGALEAYLLAKYGKKAAGAMGPAASQAMNKLPPVASGPLRAASRAAASPYGVGATLGAAGALQTPHTTGESDATNIGMGTAFGAASPLLTAPLRRFVSPKFPDPSRKPWEAPVMPSGMGADVDAWANKGRDLTGQYLPPYAYSPTGTTTGERLLSMAPGTPSRQEVAQTMQQRFTNAVGKLFGATPDAEGRVPLDVVVPEKTTEVGNAIGKLRDQYGVTEKVHLIAAKRAINAVSADPQAQAGDAGVPQIRAIEKKLQGHYSDIMGANENIDGKLYTDKRTALYDLYDDAQRQGFKPGMDAASTLRKSLDDAFNRTLAANATPEEQAAASTLNRQYSVLRTLREGPGKEIYDTQTGLIDPAALHEAAVKRGETWITGNREMPTGHPDPRVDTTNLGVSRGYENLKPDINPTNKGGHGLAEAIAPGLPGVALGIGTYELSPHETDDDSRDAIERALAVASAGTALGSTAGRLVRSPAMTEGLARHALGSHLAAPIEWGATALNRGSPYAIAPTIHDLSVAAHQGPLGAPTQPAGDATANEPQWELDRSSTQP